MYCYVSVPMMTSFPCVYTLQVMLLVLSLLGPTIFIRMFYMVEWITL